MDRTAHRWAGPAFSYGAKFHENGVPILVDDGFRAFAETFVGWHKEGLMPAEGWPAGGGTAYKNAAPLFLDGTVAICSPLFRTQDKQSGSEALFCWLAQYWLAAIP